METVNRCGKTVLEHPTPQQTSIDKTDREIYKSSIGRCSKYTDGEKICYVVCRSH